METVETQYKDNKILKIFQDDSPESPRESWDNLGKMVCFHRDYNLGDDNDLTVDSFDNWEELEESLKAVVILPVYLYDHSGITIKTTPFSCNWDSSQVGFIYCTKEDIIKEYGNNTKKNREIALKVLEGEIVTYDNYICGEVYGYTLYEKKDVCITKTYNDGSPEEREDTTEEVEIDSCWGFFGYEGLKQIREETGFK